MRHPLRLLVAALLCPLPCGCISTSLLYNPNLYQTGAAAGKGHWRLGGAATIAPVLSTDADSSGVSTSIPSTDPGLAIGLWGQVGVASKIDVGLGVDGNVHGDHGSVGLRGFAVFQMSQPDRQWTFAFVPQAFFIHGSHVESETSPKLVIESRAYGAELQVPATLRLAAHTDFICTSRVVYLRYEAPFEYHAVSAGNDRSFTDGHNLVGGGIGLGVRYRILHPELSVLFSNNQPLYSLGLSLHN